MVGTIVNVIGILAGGMAGLIRRKPIRPEQEHYFRLALVAFTMFYGLRLSWISFHGSFLQILKQLIVAMLAMSVGKWLGKLLMLQRGSNRLGQFARDRMSEAGAGAPRTLGAGFQTCAALFCAAPLGILGAIQDGASQYPWALCVKAVIDGLAMMGFVSLFGWGTFLSALPVLVFQGSISLLCLYFVGPFLAAHGLLATMNIVGGLLVFSTGLVLMGLKKIELADYLPSLALAPLITWLWR